MQRNSIDRAANEPLAPQSPQRRSLLAGAVAAAALTACGSGGSSSSSANVRVLNATLTHASIDFLVDGTVSQAGVPLDGLSSYASTAATGSSFAVNDAGSSNGLATLTPALASDAFHTLVAVESAGTVSLVLVDENFTEPAVGSATLRVADYAVQAGKLDCYVTTSAVTDPSALSSLTPVGTLAPTASTGFVISLTYGPGNLFVTLTGSGNPSDVRIFNEPVTLASQEVATVLITPASGGLLVNGGLLVQQGGYTPFRTSTARVRLATAVTGNATVAASANANGVTTTIDAGSVSPQLGSYVAVPAGSAINVTVNGASVATPAGAIAAGGDYTILVMGDPGDATATLITDDNRPSTDATQAKLRLINAISGNASNLLTLTVNSVTIASAIAPGQASGYATVPGSTTASDLVLFSNQAPGVYYSNSALVFSAGGVFTIFATGPFTAPFLLVR